MKIDNSKFCQLHCHTVYSQRDGAIPVRKLVDLCVDKFGQKAVAISDHGTLSGAYELYSYSTITRKTRSKPIIGIEFYVNPHRKELFEWLPNADKIKNKKERAEIRKSLAKYHHILAIAKNRNGYYNLIKCHNDAWKNGFYFRPMITLEMLLENGKDLIVSTACQNGIIPVMLGKGLFDEAEREVAKMKEVFGKDFYLELMPINHEAQKGYNELLINLAKKTSTPMIVTNDCHYVEKDDAEVHRILINLDKLKKSEETGKAVDMWEFSTTDLYVKNAEDMYNCWKAEHKSDVFTESVFESCMENVSNIIDQIEPYDLEGSPKLPKFAEDDWSLFVDLVMKGFEYRMKQGLIPKERMREYMDRTKMEMEVIKKIRAVNYLLVCWDIMRFCRENHIETGCGRGCFLPESRVSLTNGNKIRIKDIKIGDKIKNYFAKEAKVIDKYEYLVDEEVLELDFGKTKIRCTKDHKFYTLNRGWVEANNLKDNDEIAEIPEDTL